MVVLLEPGTVLGKYRILRMVGRGGMGVVYLAEDESLGRQIALKILDRTVTSAEDFEWRFRQEARTIAALRHPNVVRIHAFEKVADDLVIDMEYVEGGSLADLPVNHVVMVGEVVRYLCGVLDALACCHAAGIIHRDVKPSNILLGRNGAGSNKTTAFLSDFGLAKLAAWHERSSVQGRSSSSLFVGTPRYAPPESWDAQEPTPAWDVYSVGAVLYEAAASSTPYDAETPLALMKQMIERPVPPLSEVSSHLSPELSGVVERMLERDPAKRIQDAAEALELLQKTPEAQAESSDGTRTVIRKKRAYPKWRGPRRESRLPSVRRMGIGGLVSILVVVAAAGAWYFRDMMSRSTMRVEAISVPTAKTQTVQVMDTVDPAAQTTWKNHALMRQGKSPSDLNILACESTHLWSMGAMVDKDGAATLTGDWAEYTDESAQVFRYGSLTGTGQWFAEEGNLAVSLSFRCTQDASTWERSFLLKRAAEPSTDEEFVQRMEGADFIQGLLYRELLPRGLAWISTVEGEWASAGLARLFVPKTTEKAGGIQVEGRLEEAEWRVAASGQQGQSGTVAGGPGSEDASLLARYDNQGVYIGIRVKRPLGTPRLTLSLLNRFCIPVSDSPRWRADFEDGRVTAQRHVSLSREAPWECQWNSAVNNTNQAWEAEVFIPFANLDMRDAPTAGTRWRMNCLVVEGSAGETKQVAQWGAKDPDDAEHGMLLVFGAT